jgi:hypothetical protein
MPVNHLRLGRFNDNAGDGFPLNIFKWERICLTCLEPIVGSFSIYPKQFRFSRLVMVK